MFTGRLEKRHPKEAMALKLCIQHNCQMIAGRSKAKL